MTKSQVKEILRGYRIQRSKVEALRLSLAVVREDCAAIQAVCADALPGSGTHDPVSASVARLLAEEANYRSQIDRLCRTLRCVEQMISAVDGDGAVILRERYINGTPFEAIAERMHLSERSMWREYNRSVSKIAEALSQVGSDWQ